MTADTMCPSAPAGTPPGCGVRGAAIGKRCFARSAGVSQPWATMPSRTKFQRATAPSGLTAGSHRDGDWITPASTAPSATVRSCTFLPKYAWLAAWMP